MTANHRILQLLALLALITMSYPLSTARAQLSFTTNTYSVGAGPAWVVAADLNGDGKLDLITANSDGHGSGNTLTVLTNNSSGGFGSNATLSVGGGPACLVAVDINWDGKLDLISANYGTAGSGNTLTVLTNNGSGGFGSNATLNVGYGPRCVVAADVNGDGRLDLISANYAVLDYGSNLSVLTNNGSGGFGSNAMLNVGYGPRCVAAADVTGDRRLDLISANYFDLTVLTNDGSGGFGSNATLNVGSTPMYVLAADANEDGKMDLISANYGNGGSGNMLTVLTNNGSGGFGSNVSLSVGEEPVCVVMADVNGDGKADLISADFLSNTLTVLTNNGSGGFGFNATLSVGGNPSCVVAAEVNGDGRLDLISANYGVVGSGNTVTVLINTTPFPPSLNIALAGGQVALYWPAAATNYVLLSATSLAAPDWTAVTNSTWQGITNGVPVLGVTLTNTSPALFFRLQAF